MNDWRSILKASPAPQYPQNPQNEREGGGFEHIEDIAHGESVSLDGSSPLGAHPSEAPLAPAAPIEPGWIVTYTSQHGALCGGWEERDKATVSRCEWNGRAWFLHLNAGQVIPLSAIRGIGQTNHEGHLIAAWTVRAHGYDGNALNQPNERTS